MTPSESSEDPWASNKLGADVSLSSINYLWMLVERAGLAGLNREGGETIPARSFIRHSARFQERTSPSRKCIA
jgi:hypothetical protein